VQKINQLALVAHHATIVDYNNLHEIDS
jgi:hypothetical protein